MRTLSTLLAALGGVVLLAAPLTAADKSGVDQEQVEKVVVKGLEYLKKSQASDGSWSAGGGQNPAVMTGLAGISLLMEGSTCREGKYSDNISKAVEWYFKNAQPNGLLGDPRREGSYTYGHGYGLLFLSCVYGEEEDPGTRKKLEGVLKRAVEFSCKSVTTKGGWGYVSGSDGGDFDEGSTTVTQLQGLRAARNAGIVVPKNTIDKAIKYLKDCTTPRGGLIYNYVAGAAVAGAERPAITAAACASACSTGMYSDKYFGMWVKYCREGVYKQFHSNGHDDYCNLYFGQVMYMLGDDRYHTLIDKEAKADAMTWSEYKKMAFNSYIKSQAADGSWSQGIGPIFSTSTALIIMQQEKALVPFFQR